MSGIINRAMPSNRRREANKCLRNLVMAGNILEVYLSNFDAVTEAGVQSAVASWQKQVIELRRLNPVIVSTTIQE